MWSQLSSRYFAADRFPNLNNCQLQYSPLNISVRGTRHILLSDFFVSCKNAPNEHNFTEIEDKGCLLNNYQFSLFVRSPFSVTELVYTSICVACTDSKPSAISTVNSCTEFCCNGTKNTFGNRKRFSVHFLKYN